MRLHTASLHTYDVPWWTPGRPAAAAPHTRKQQQMMEAARAGRAQRRCWRPTAPATTPPAVAWSYRRPVCVDAGGRSEWWGLVSIEKGAQGQGEYLPRSRAVALLPCLLFWAHVPERGPIRTATATERSKEFPFLHARLVLSFAWFVCQDDDDDAQKHRRGTTPTLCLACSSTLPILSYSIQLTHPPTTLAINLTTCVSGGWWT